MKKHEWLRTWRGLGRAFRRAHPPISIWLEKLPDGAIELTIWPSGSRHVLTPDTVAQIAEEITK